jgi:hypothetical protein
VNDPVRRRIQSGGSQLSGHDERQVTRKKEKKRIEEKKKEEHAVC